MSLPGLNFNPHEYAEYLRQTTDGDYRMIPFSDWLPPDHVDVLCDIGGELKVMYYSPARNCMVSNETHTAGVSVDSARLNYWLKKL